MRLEYFQMIDRSSRSTLDERTDHAPICTVPEQSPVFEGHFPGYPLMPGVLMIEMHGADLRLAGDARCTASPDCRSWPA